jgi:alanine racemase
MNYSLSELALVCGAQVIGEDVFVSHLLIDSRKIRHAKDAMFLAISGAHHDGHDYIEAAFAHGVHVFMVEKTEGLPQGCAALLVTNTVQALQKIARHHRSQFDYPLVAITGSAGKTVFKETAYRALSSFHSIIRSPRSFNSQIGVPLSILAMDSSHDLALMEAGISMPGEMALLSDMLKPDIGIFTDLAEAHDNGFTSRLEKLEEKALLFASCQRIIYCKDDPMVHEVMSKKHGREKCFTWGKDPDSDLHLVAAEQEPDISKVTYCSGGKSQTLHIPMDSEYDLAHRMRLIALMILLGHSADRIAAQLSKKLDEGRSIEMIDGRYKSTLLSDQSPLDGPSIMSAMDTLSVQAAARDKVIILMANPHQALKNELRSASIASAINEENIDQVHLIGTGLEQLAKQIPTAQWHKSVEAFLGLDLSLLVEGRIVLVKGVWSPEYSAIRSALVSSGHRTVLTVDLEAMVHNLNYYRERLSPGVKTMAMVKAFSYGSGDAEVAQVLDFHGVDYLAVAYADEGVTLRKKGLESPIMVMNWGEEDMDNLISFRLEPEVYSVRALDMLKSAMKTRMIDGFPIHLKVDTGMNRLGMSAESLIDVWSDLKNQQALSVRSIFSHLLASDDADQDQVTANQLAAFSQIKKEIKSNGGEHLLFHVLNTAGILRFPDEQHEMVRLGIGLYGHSPVEEHNLEPVISLHSEISQIKTVKAGETIGYGGQLKLNRDMRIAILPVGYADGLSRRLGNGHGSVCLGDKRAPFVGNICMDMCMIDISDITCHEGSRVEIIGPQKPLNELAKELDTIAYEVLTSISHRVKRLYINA